LQDKKMDFTSALYLGITHPFHSLASWEQLTTGRPDILLAPRRNRYVGAELAKLSGCEKAALGPSTFHLFWDVFNILADERIAFYFDRSVYPIARWAAARAVEKGIPVRWFPHHDPEALGRKVADGEIRGQRPVVVSDGFCPGCGKHAPIAAYMDMVQPRGGRLVIDDTQALGIWGRHPNPFHPYGRNGGGSLRRAGISHRCIILINSLAKAFGAPLAMIAGSKNFFQRFRAESQTRVHCSPPSTAAVAAAIHALAVNAAHGDALRRRLSQLVFFFKKQQSHIPMAKTSARSGIYKIYQKGSLLYIGETGNLRNRLMKHALNIRRFNAPGPFTVKYAYFSGSKSDRVRIQNDIINYYRNRKGFNITNISEIEEELVDGY
jgi:8-amino-7-oxononanoate synthase